MAERPSADALTGFPEWLPGDAALEQQVISEIRAGFDCYGFQPVDVAAVQPRAALYSGGAQYSDGGMTKPVFNLEEPPEERTSTPLGLRYDLTVPLARFVAKHSGELDFPLHYYQINKVWRAERPTHGHWREFYQCDVDVIGHNELDLYYDAEIACALNAAFEKIGLNGFTVRISNRKVIAALLATHRIYDDRTRSIVHIVDEGGRQPAEETVRRLAEAGVARSAAGDLGELLGCRSLPDAELLLDSRGADTAGLKELEIVMRAARQMGVPADRLCLDFSITRGHDYYTGTVYETFVAGREEWGAIGSGGRYDNLFRGVAGATCPGVGVSIGLTRLIGLLRTDPAVARPRLVSTLVVPVAAGAAPSVALVAGHLRGAAIPARALFDLTTEDDAVTLAVRLGAETLITVSDPHLGENHSSGGVTLRRPVTGSPEVVQMRTLAEFLANSPAAHR
jgi:histidyl-tRNA synthetase